MSNQQNDILLEDLRSEAFHEMSFDSFKDAENYGSESYIDCHRVYCIEEILGRFYILKQ